MVALRLFVRTACVVAFFLAAAGSVAAQKIHLQNLDGVPYPDRLAFSRIGTLSSPPTNGVHERVVLRITNTGTSGLSISRLVIGGTHRAKFALEGIPMLPAVIAPSSSLDLTVRYVAESGRRVHDATLAISSNDPVNSVVVVELSGYWQPVSENGKEPSLSQIVNVFGYKTVIVDSGDTLNKMGRIEASGDEVISAYWRQADTSLPVRVRQLAAYHTYPANHGVYWHYQGSTSATLIFRHHGQDSQSILPRKKDSSLPAAGKFTPSAGTSGGVFGFRIESNEWSDPSLNDTSKDDCSGGADTCGHHVRFWPVKDRLGSTVPNQFMMTMDFAGINFDYNDNVYLVSNVTPATPINVLAFVESGGVVAMESENFGARISRSGKSWEPRNLTGNVGTSMRAEPVTLVNNDTGYATSSPEMQYYAQFTTTGTYYVWVRAQAADRDSDSWHVGLNGQQLASADRMAIGSPLGTWMWINKTMDPERASIRIPSPGTHILNLWMREDGVYVDRIVLTTNPNFVPAGTGPVESPRAATTSADLYASAVATSVATASLPSNASVPERYELRQNYPNPFNPTTSIEYALPEEIHVTLEVFDALGRRVAVLVDALQPAGVHSAVFQADGLATGLYVYRLRAGPFMQVSRMILTK